MTSIHGRRRPPTYRRWWQRRKMPPKKKGGARGAAGAGAGAGARRTTAAEPGIDIVFDKPKPKSRGHRQRSERNVRVSKTQRRDAAVAAAAAVYSRAVLSVRRVLRERGGGGKHAWSVVLLFHQTPFGRRDATKIVGRTLSA